MSSKTVATVVTPTHRQLQLPDSMVHRAHTLLLRFVPLARAQAAGAGEPVRRWFDYANYQLWLFALVGLGLAAFRGLFPLASQDPPARIFE